MKFLFYPAPAHGHVNPMLPLFQELVSRGDEVVVHVTREFEAAVRHTGASLRLLDDRLTIPSTLSGGGSGTPFKQLMPMILGLMSQGLREAPRLAEQARAEQADCIVYDPMVMWGHAIAGLLHLPTAIFHTSFALSHSPTLKRELKKTMKGLPPPRALLAMLELLWACRE